MATARTPEAAWLATVRAAARHLGWMDYHVRDARGSAHGFPDLLLVRPPRCIVAELKSETGRLTKPQVAWLALFAACPHFETFVWRPDDDWDAIQEVLR
jgi:hypothetical protein